MRVVRERGCFAVGDVEKTVAVGCRERQSRAYIRLFFTRCENRGRFLKWSHLSLHRRPDNDPTTTRRHLGTKFIYISTVIRYWYRIMPRRKVFFLFYFFFQGQFRDDAWFPLDWRPGEGKTREKKISKETKQGAL